ncbi:MAG: prolipoprotein diacylglyceryl transferase [Desulfocapsaceae bacterium]|nr:prolipoprotein diacylglyceryl transferase [Desulfocapsaceae bacterium]
MSDLFFLLAAACLLGLFLAWGFRYLPGERWQMLAVIPRIKGRDEQWQGLNLTYYGLFLATSQTLAVVLLLILLGAAGVSLAGTLAATAIILAVCIPASRIVAIMVEKKRHTFTVGGASFVGILLAPWCITLVATVLNGFFTCRLPMMPVLAAMAVAYTLGEGLGRLGCISFGCCYGRALKDCSPLMQRIFTPTALIFHGPTKKAIYEGGLAGEPLIPIQAITCVLYCLTAVVGSLLFLRGHFAPALFLGIGISQIWRIVSETMRADFRGFSTISAYQKMGGLSVLYVLCLIVFFRQTPQALPSIVQGLALLWHPGLILGLQGFWLLAFMVFGRSTVTTSTVSFQLIQEHL